MPDAAFASPRTDAVSRPETRDADLWPLEAHNLVFEARGRRLVDVPNLRLVPGPLTVIMGPNGAGKSLLLRLLHGLLAPAAGTVLAGGRPLGPAERRRQAMVFQRPILLRRSARANLVHALRARGVPRGERRERAEAALEAAGLGALARMPARVLSGGEQQRLAVARALVVRPEILFLDEPAASLDPASTAAIEAQLAGAKTVGTTIVLVTHDVGQARRLADAVVFMHQGRILEHTPAERFFDAPHSREAADFLAGRLVL